MLTILLIGALVFLLVILGRESGVGRTPKVVEIVDVDDEEAVSEREARHLRP